MSVELIAIVKGRVQGVGFRATAVRLAEGLNLTGFVRNLPDGSVEICAQGKQVLLEKFLSQLRYEFPSSNIMSIDAHYRNPSKTYIGFKRLS